jgi:hypothetical protein
MVELYFHTIKLFINIENPRSKFNSPLPFYEIHHVFSLIVKSLKGDGEYMFDGVT